MNSSAHTYLTAAAGAANSHLVEPRTQSGRLLLDVDAILDEDDSIPGGEAALIMLRLGRLGGAVQVGAAVRERSVVRASYVVDCDRVEAFDEGLHQLGGEQAGRLRFEYSGGPRVERLPAAA